MARAFGRSMSPTFGFVVYGFLFLFVAATAWVAVLFATRAAFAQVLPTPIPSWATWVSESVALFAFGLSWWPFARWVRRRRGRLVRLFREGQLDTARIVNPRKHRIRGAPWTKLTLEIERAGRVRTATLSIGGHPPALFEPEATCPVLSHPEVDHCAAFVLGGEPIAAKFEAR